MPEPTQVNNLPGVATEVPAIPSISWLSQPSATLCKVGVKTCPELLHGDLLQRDSNPCLLNTSRNMLTTRPPVSGHIATHTVTVPMERYHLI